MFPLRRADPAAAASAVVAPGSLRSDEPQAVEAPAPFRLHARILRRYEHRHRPGASGSHLSQDYHFGLHGTDRVGDPPPRCNGFRTSATFDTPFPAAPAVECCPIAPFRRPQRAFWQHPSRADPRQPAYASLSGPSALASLEMDPGNRIFATLPVVPVPERMDRE